MNHLSCLFAAALALTLASPATADPFTFKYSVSGDANAMQVGASLEYSFEPFAEVITRLGTMEVTYQGTIDFSLQEPSGPTTATWDFGPLGTFSGSGLQFVGFPDMNGTSLFHGTSTITGGTGIFESATGSTSYTGSANLVSNTAEFTERVDVSAPGLIVPEPSSVLLTGTALFGLLVTRYRRWREREGLMSR